MFALRQIIEDPGDFIPVPTEVKHRRTEVIFLVVESPSSEPQSSAQASLASLAGSWEGELVREPQQDYEERLGLD